MPNGAAANKRANNPSYNDGGGSKYSMISVLILQTVLLLLHCHCAEAVEGCLRLTEGGRPALFCQHCVQQLPLDNNLPYDLANLRIIGVKSADMEHNGILTRHNLTGLETLTYLELSNFNLLRIEYGTFQHMKNLRSLDLSRNLMKIIQPGTFSGLQLNSLTLSENHGLHISQGAFGASEIHKLVARGCDLEMLDYSTISDAKIRHLGLSHNQITWLDPEFRKIIQPQSHEDYFVHPRKDNWGFIDLTNNPIACNCHIFWFARVIETQMLIFEREHQENKSTNQSFVSHISIPGAEQQLIYELNVTCASPAHLVGKRLPHSWQFHCPNPQIIGIDIELITKELDFAQLTCTARGKPTPSLQWTYEMDGHKVQNTLNSNNYQERKIPSHSRKNLDTLKAYGSDIFDIPGKLYERSIALNVSLSSQNIKNFTCTAWNDDKPKLHNMYTFVTSDHQKSEHNTDSEFSGVRNPRTIRMHEITMRIHGPNTYSSRQTGQIEINSPESSIDNIDQRAHNVNMPSDSVHNQDKREYNYLYIKRFTLLQMLGAVVGTFIVTLALLYIVTHCMGPACSTTNQLTLKDLGRATSGSKISSRWYGLLSQSYPRKNSDKMIRSQSSSEKTPVDSDILIGKNDCETEFTILNNETNRFNLTAGPSTVPLRRQKIPQALLMKSVPIPPVDRGSTPPANPAYWPMPEYIYSGSLNHEYDVPKPLDTITSRKSMLKFATDSNSVNPDATQTILNLSSQHTFNNMHLMQHMQRVRDQTPTLLSRVTPTNYWTQTTPTMMINPLLSMNENSFNLQQQTTTVAQCPQTQSSTEFMDYPTYLQARPYPFQPLLELITHSPQWFLNSVNTINQPGLPTQQVMNSAQLESNHAVEQTLRSDSSEQI